VKPIVGITMGDVAGIGPEIIAKALSLKETYEVCRPLVIGDARSMIKAQRIAGTSLKTNPIQRVSEARFAHGFMDILDLHNVDVDEIKMGEVNAASGRASVEYVERAVELALRGEIDAVVTAPINKEAINRAGYDYAGHTEILAHLTQSKEYAMMLVAGPLRVVHVTTHVSLKKACQLITKERVFAAIRLAHQAIQKIGIKRPRVAVAALNPHRGEGGLFGKEEITQIAPAVEEAKNLGWDVVGPLPADTVFVKARGGAFDVVVAMYHDQGHIPVKLAGLEWREEEKRWTAVGGVNVTLGLPILRTSVDHGTAYGKAGKGTANPQSLIEAIKTAARMAEAR